MKSPKPQSARILSRVRRFFRDLDRRLPRVRPFTGPESMRHGPGERRLLIQGKVVLIPKR